jgi:hypothetical protein
VISGLLGVLCINFVLSIHPLWRKISQVLVEKLKQDIMNLSLYFIRRNYLK